MTDFFPTPQITWLQTQMEVDADRHEARDLRQLDRLRGFGFDLHVADLHQCLAIRHVDLTEDNAIAAAEMKAMEESFRKRREGSQALARDPIVYGVAAADGAFIIRTGTRLFCVGGN